MGAFIVIGILINFAIAVLIARWVFKVNKIVDLLETISRKLDRLPSDQSKRWEPPKADD